jgi:hypothetical protein
MATLFKCALLMISKTFVSSEVSQKSAAITTSYTTEII